VFTVVAPAEQLVEALAAGIAVAVARIDLRSHEGVHPRVGAADVVPIVRFADDDDRPERAARLLARRVAMLGVPVLGYGELGDGRTARVLPAGRPGRLAERLAAGELQPLAGPDELHETAGAVLLGCASRWSRSNSTSTPVTARWRGASRRPSGSATAGCPACRRSAWRCEAAAGHRSRRT
jgi:glutamate formiminotransferase